MGSAAKEVQSSLDHVPFGALLPPKELRIPAAKPVAAVTTRPAGTATDDGNLDILPIPHSLQEIYRVSNTNRKKQTKVRITRRVAACNPGT